ncbi:MAG TPA: type I methionyl aminopeptidase [Thermoanaerobaculaceae bacterium]|nr:type I methionyl aminopeptidase [Thermoanaerobaculaceae bacterium]
MILKTPAELSVMDRANAVVHETLRLVAETAKPGVSTKELDELAEAHIRAAGGQPAFKGYRGYPATLCTSVNDVIVHGIPSASHHLRDGDILGVDCGVVLDGFVGDSAVTVAIGEVSDEARRLMRVTKECLELAVERVRPGRRLTDIGAAIQEHAEAAGYSVVRDLVGHGIGRAMHEDPQVYNFGPAGRGPELRPGLVLAIEPMINAGKSGVSFDDDGWTARTEDGKLSAHFEYSVAVTENGPWVLGVDGR